MTARKKSPLDITLDVPEIKTKTKTKTKTKNSETPPTGRRPEEEREREAVDKALELIEKKYGKGTAMRLGKKPNIDIDVYSTGSLKLNQALGIGGLPHGRIVEIYGPESSGKCLTADALVLAANGYLTISEIFMSAELPTDDEPRETEFSFGVINRHGEVENTSHLTHNGKQKVLKITTSSGNQIKCTPNHPHLVMNERGNWVWKKTSAMLPGDYLVSYRAHREDHSNSLNEETVESYLLGVVFSRGQLSEQSISIPNDDPCIQKMIESDGYKIFGVCAETKRYGSNDTESAIHYFKDKESVSRFCRKTELYPGGDAEKKLPLSIRKMNSECLKNFIRGYVDSGSFVHKEKASIEITDTSHLLLFQLKAILQQSFGVICSLHKRETIGGLQGSDWCLTIRGDEAKRYKRVIGTNSKLRAGQLEELGFGNEYDSNPACSVPNCGWLLRDLYDASETSRSHNELVCDHMQPNPRSPLTYDRLARIITSEARRANKEVKWANCSALARLREINRAGYFYDRVEFVEDLPNAEYTFDLVCPDTHSFIANGIVTHNTTLALHVIAEAQKNRKQCAFIDAEHALDARYAKNIGVDIEDLVSHQPDHGEQALDILDMLLDSSGVGVIVVDSVAALVPRAEIEGDMGDSHMGLQARLMSQALRKITAKAQRTGTTVIFLNQLRSKIGVFFGSNETTTGGNALKFYASIRMDIRRIGSDKNSDGELNANKVRIKVVKNKLAPPFKQAETAILFGVGFDLAAEILDMGIEYDLIDKSGSWLEYGEHRLQGRARFLELIRENEDLRQELYDKALNIAINDG